MRENLKETSSKMGADLFGVADLERLEGIETRPSDLLETFETAVSVAVRLSDFVLDSIENEPTPLYAHQYREANKNLNGIAFRIQNQLQRQGHKAVAIGASQVLDMGNGRAHISHKAVGKAAGLGWLGKSLLLVNSEYGPRIRLVSILTTADLKADEPVRNRCEGCISCVEACPADAVKDVDWDDHPETREEALRFERCKRLLSEEFARRDSIGESICGVCVRACPYGK